MTNASERLSLLLNRFLEKTITSEELRELSSLLDEVAESEISIILKKVYDKTSVPTFLADKLPSEHILAQILQRSEDNNMPVNAPTKKIRPLIIKLTAAAAVIGLVVGFFIFPSRNQQPNSQPISSIQDNDGDILPGGNRATLKMSDGTTIVLTNSPNGILAQYGSMAVKKLADGQLIFDAGSSTTENRQSSGWNTISTPRGGQYQLTLSDGSKVWLNAESSLRFPLHFIGDERRVELVGEAYFEVAKNRKQTFKVMSKQMEIQVLGTHFNLSDYDGQSTSKTTLVSGSIKIKRGTQVHLLRPGQQAVLNKNKELTLLDHVDVESEIAWKNGLFLFKDASIQHVMEQIARWYDIEVAYQKNHSKKLLNGSVPRTVHLSALMEMLAYTGVEYEIQGKKVLIKN